MDERELVKRAQDGDFTAFSTLIGQYQPKLFGLALKLAKNKEDAEDVFQETFLKAIDKIQQFRGDSSFGTWLYSIAVNVVRTRYGRESKKELLPLEEYLPAKHGHAEGDAPQLLDWNDPLSKMAADEIREKINTAIAALPIKYRLPFLLRYTQDMSVQEVADALKLSLAATKSRILRARLALRKALGEYLSGETNDVTVS